jgi:hypothetical protein
MDDEDPLCAESGLVAIAQYRIWTPNAVCPRLENDTGKADIV